MESKPVYKRYLYIIAILIVVLILAPFVLFPWSQENQESFNAWGTICEVIAITIAAALLWYFIKAFKQKKN